MAAGNTGGSNAEQETEEEKEKGQEQEGAELDWFVQARLEGTVLGAPADGVARRFTSFFSSVVLELDGKAFPDVAAVEVSLVLCVKNLLLNFSGD